MIGEQLKPQEIAKPIGDPDATVRDELTALGYTHEAGLQAAYMADGTPYVTLYNGAEAGGAKGAVVPLPTPQLAVKHTIDAINARAVAESGKVLVWRQPCDLQRRDGGYVLRARLAVFVP